MRTAFGNSKSCCGEPTHGSDGDGVRVVAKVVIGQLAQGFDLATVKKVEHLLYIAEYKRFQSAPGVRLTQKAFWLDRRYPIAMRWRDGSGA